MVGFIKVKDDQDIVYNINIRYIVQYYRRDEKIVILFCCGKNEYTAILSFETEYKAEKYIHKLDAVLSTTTITLGRE
jgi:hypothetical protein